MADAAVAITAGSGTNVDTRTEGTNGNHRQVIVIGDPASNAGVAPVDATNGLTVALSPPDNTVLDTIETNTDFGAVVGGGVEATALRVTIANDSTGVISVDDGGGTLTVDGTVTANLSATDNAVLDTIETNTDFGAVVGGGVEATALRVTIASDSTGVLSVDDGGGALTVDGTVTANLSATDNAVLDNIDTSTTNIADALAGEYETVAASQTTQALGATGATGDYLDHLLVVPATTSPGNVQIKDGAGSAITVFTGGASSVSNLVPFSIPLGLYSAAGAWQVTTGANVSVIAGGNFT